MRMRLAATIAMLIVGVSNAAETCEMSMSEITSEKSILVTPAQIAGINRQMRVVEILRRLGPAARNVGSGLLVLEWDMTDGRIFRLNTAGPCDAPFSIWVVTKPASNNALERPHGQQLRHG